MALHVRELAVAPSPVERGEELEAVADVGGDDERRRLRRASCAYPTAWPKASCIARFQAAVPRFAVPSFLAPPASEPCFASRMKWSGLVEVHPADAGPLPLVEQDRVSLERVDVLLGVAGRRLGLSTPRTSQRSRRKWSLLARSAASEADHFFTKEWTFMEGEVYTGGKRLDFKRCTSQRARRRACTVAPFCGRHLTSSRR